MSPFILVLELATPMIPSPYTTLDALLAAALYRQYRDLTIAHHQIPLKRSDGVWHGSSLIHYGGGFHSREQVIVSTLQRDIDPHYYTPTGMNGQYLKASFKSEEKPHYIRNRADKYELVTSEGVLFYGCGNGEHSLQLIEDNISGIGRKTNQGHGMIRSLHLTPIEVDCSLHNEKGEPMRPIPKEIWHRLPNTKSQSVREDVTGWRPPYWDPDHRASCVVPPLFRQFS